MKLEEWKGLIINQATTEIQEIRGKYTMDNWYTERGNKKITVEFTMREEG